MKKFQLTLDQEEGEEKGLAHACTGVKAPQLWSCNFNVTTFAPSRRVSECTWPRERLSLFLSTLVQGKKEGAGDDPPTSSAA